MPSPSDESPLAPANLSEMKYEPTAGEIVAEDRFLVLRERGLFVAAIMLSFVGAAIVSAAGGSGKNHDPNVAACAVAVVMSGISATLFLHLARQALGFFVATASLILFLIAALWTLAIFILTLGAVGH